MESHASKDVRATEPQVIGRYALFDELAAGGMATVHVGRFVGHVGFSRIVAIKRLHPQFAKDPEFVGMFLDEARLASRIQHPNVVATLDVVKVLNEAFLVMEYVQGAALSRLVRASIERRERVPQEIAASIAANMLHGLHAAHEAKSEKREPLSIVHRDVSPQNVIVGVDGVARVLDFGIAKAAMRSQSTRDGQMKGKLSYMSPEQLNGLEVDRRTDIFAAGIVLWESLAARRLFDGSDAGAILAKVLSHPIPNPKQFAPEISDTLAAIVLKALDRDPSKRFQTARDFAIAIEDAVVFARPRAIGEWVQRLAGTDLERRAEVVARVESWSAEANRDAEFVTVMESGENPETTESTGLRARPSPPPGANEGDTRSERVATSPSQVGNRPSGERVAPSGSRARVATSPSQVLARNANAAAPPAPPGADAPRSGGPPLPRLGSGPLPPLVPPMRGGTSPSVVAARAAMLAPPAQRERTATSPSNVAARAAMLGALPPPPEPPRDRVATTPSEVAARAAMLGAPVLETSAGEMARSLSRARVMTTPAKHRIVTPPLPPGAAAHAAPALGHVAVSPAAAMPAAVASSNVSPTPSLGKKRPAPMWAIAAALVLATAVGAIVAMRVATKEKVSAPDFGAAAEAARPVEPPVRPAATSPEPAPKATVPVMNAADLPLEKPEGRPSVAPKGERDTVTPKPVRPKASGSSSSCNPPYVIDAKGIKRLKPNCI
jgi:serine/threonine-protein kinase